MLPPAWLLVGMVNQTSCLGWWPCQYIKEVRKINRVPRDAIHGFVCCLSMYLAIYLISIPLQKHIPHGRKVEHLCIVWNPPITSVEISDISPLRVFMGKCRCFPPSINLYWCYSHCFPHAFPLCFRGSKPRLITSSKPQESFEIWSQPQPPQRNTLNTPFIFDTCSWD